MAKGIGTIQNDRFGGAPLTWRYARKLYARVNGREYGDKIATDVMPTVELPSSVELRANYPNPFSVSTFIPFEVPEISPIRVVIYDLLGQEVAVLVESVVGPGEHKVMWKPDHVSSGLYVCELVVGDARQSQLLVYLK